jgi:hypothetical protein
MRRLLFCLAVLAVSKAPAGAQPSAPYRPASLAAELRGLQTSLGHSAYRQFPSFPSAWEVETPQGRYSISTEPLRTLLQANQRDKRDTRVQQAQAWLDLLAQQLESFETAAPASAGGARAKLDRILARPEFAAAGPPSPLELWRRRVAAWLQELLRRIFGVVAGHPTASQFLFWLLVAGCVGILAVWLIRWWTRNGEVPGLPRPARSGMVVRTWQEWLAAAHHAAAAGDWRQAIHSSYWAAISRLQDSGALPADVTRTPREYLRLTSGPPVRDPLAALTSGLERFWYGRRAARAEDFRESLTQLEALGCKVE